MARLSIITVALLASVGAWGAGLGDLFSFSKADEPKADEPKAVELQPVEERQAETAEVESVAADATKSEKKQRTAKITSDTVTYDRKEGFAVFNGKVFVDDESYQMHADKVVVFMSGTNDLERIVALGNVALTNGLKSATGVKASYHRGKGMVILYGDEGTPAVVRDESEKGTQSVVGERIRLWINSERVEVLKALISAPVGDIDKDKLRKSL